MVLFSSIYRKIDIFELFFEHLGRLYVKKNMWLVKTRSPYIKVDPLTWNLGDKSLKNPRGSLGKKKNKKSDETT